MDTERARIYVDTPDIAFRWALRKAATDRQQSLARFVSTILGEWLTNTGYLPEKSIEEEMVDRERVSV